MVARHSRLVLIDHGNLVSCKAGTPDFQLIASSVPKMRFFGTLDPAIYAMAEIENN
jgi:hypothetical protein